MSELVKVIEASTNGERDIIVFNQAKQKYDVLKTASTSWKDIAELIEGNAKLEVSNIKNMRAVLQSSQVTLELPAANVPEGTQKIFLFEAKVKSGATKAKVEKPKTTSTFDEMGYNDMRKLLTPRKAELTAKGITLPNPPTRQSLISALEALSGVKVDKVAKTTPKGNTKVTVVKDETAPEVKAEVAKVVASLETQPNLEERITGLEVGFATLVEGLFKACSDFVKGNLPVEEISKVFSKKKDADNFKTTFDKSEINALDLAREAQALKL